MLTIISRLQRLHQSPQTVEIEIHHDAPPEEVFPSLSPPEPEIPNDSQFSDDTYDEIYLPPGADVPVRMRRE